MSGTGQVLELNYPFAESDLLAANISNYWTTWDSLRSEWLAQRKELRSYLFATDTTTTTNSQLPWKNKTTLPKLTQIRDNLHANYMAALFPNEDWLSWEGADEQSVVKEKREAIEAYMKTKLHQSNFKKEVDKMVLDYIDAGNAFSLVSFERDVIQKTLPVRETTVKYVGPRTYRIAPQDIVFNPHANSFYDSPKIIRSIMTVGDLMKEIEVNPEMAYSKVAIQKMIDMRSKASEAAARGDSVKETGSVLDGFGGWNQYFLSGFVELLTFYGDIYDQETNTLMRDRKIIIADRSWVICNKENPSWYGRAPIHHVGWRNRADNLWAMGPLDNLVGIQYRIDHVENLKADAVDMIVFPVIKIKGAVEDFSYGPNERIYVHDDGDVEFMHPDAAALQMNSEIDLYENRMEAYAGAPKDAMGIRTPGEKTAYEVNQLQTAAGRIFQVKSVAFEENLVEPTINDMLESSRRNMDIEDVVKVVDNETGAQEFLNLKKSDLTAKGRLRPMGARHFAEVAKTVQELTAFTNSAMAQDPAVAAHLSGFALAQTIEQLLGVRKFGLVKKNIRILEEFEKQQMVNSAQEQLHVESSMPVEETPGQLGMPEAAAPMPMPPGG